MMKLGGSSHDEDFHAQGTLKRGPYGAGPKHQGPRAGVKSSTKQCLCMSTVPC